jgi:hypothetical protein
MGDFFFNTSILTGEFVAHYSNEARADANFRCLPGSPLHEIIRKLGIRDWYTQNPAVEALSSDALGDAGKDELFVLGRNLYQAACGDARSAARYFEHLGTNLEQYEAEISFHMLNGMLYEIYFDSEDRFRESKKVGKLEEVFALEESEQFAGSYFIRQALLPYQKQLFYVPRTCRDVIADVNLAAAENNNSAVKHIFVEGQDVFYANDGRTLVCNSKPEFLMSKTLEEFESELRAEMTAPRRRLRVIYSTHLPNEAVLILPFDFNILRLSR